MANTFEVVDLVTRESLRIAHEVSSFIGTVDRQYDASYRQTGAKHGSDLRVRKPNQYTRTQGSRVMDVQDQDEQSSTITVATQDHVDMRFNSVELIQSVNNGAKFDDLSREYIRPAVTSLVSAIEADFLAYATKATYNLVGTAGTAITDLTVPGAARAKLNQNLAPKDGNRCVQFESVAMGGLVNGLKGLFQDSAQIKEQYREGMIGRTGMADWYENERMWTMATGADHTTVTVNDAAIADGDTTLITSGGTVAVGSVFTIADVHQVHPETKAAYAHLQQFVVTAVTGAAGSQTVTFSPALQSTGARQNIDALPATGAAMTFVGNASTSYVQQLMYHKEAYQFITADLPLMDNQQRCVRRVQDGLAMRVWMDSDIRNDELLMRIDILYGFAALRPEWGCRMIGSANA